MRGRFVIISIASTSLKPGRAASLTRLKVDRRPDQILEPKIKLVKCLTGKCKPTLFFFLPFLLPYLPIVGILMFLHLFPFVFLILYSSSSLRNPLYDRTRVDELLFNSPSGADKQFMKMQRMQIYYAHDNSPLQKGAFETKFLSAFISVLVSFSSFPTHFWGKLLFVFCVSEFVQAGKPTAAKAAWPHLPS